MKHNDKYMFGKKEFREVTLSFFFHCRDIEINKTCLDIVSILCRYVVLENLSDSEREFFLEKIIYFLNSEYHEEYEAALDCIHNLMLS